MADIVSVTPGNYTPGAQTSLDMAAAMINATWNQANTKLAAFSTKVDGIESYLDTSPVVDISADVAGTTPVTEPAVDIPSSTSATDIMTMFDAKYLELVALLVDKFTTFQNDYFPTEPVAYGAAESWIAGAVQNVDYALPAGAANALLSDARDHAYEEATTQADAVLATFAARRFPLPPGAAASAVLQINQKAQDVIAESGRKLMMVSVEQMKFAVEKAMNLRQTSMNATVEYIKSIASAPDLASRAVNTGYDAQSKLISAAASFYNARTEADRLVKQAEQFNVTTKLQKDEKNQQVDVMLVEERIKALMNEAQVLGQTAASMFNNLHASSGTDYSVNISG